MNNVLDQSMDGEGGRRGDSTTTGQELAVDNFFTTAPDEIIHIIFSFLDEDSLLTVALVCTRWHACQSSTSLWRSLYLADPVVRLANLYPNCSMKELVLKRRRLREISRGSMLAIQDNAVYIVPKSVQNIVAKVVGEDSSNVDKQRAIDDTMSYYQIEDEEEEEEEDGREEDDEVDGDRDSGDQTGEGQAKQHPGEDGESRNETFRGIKLSRVAGAFLQEPTFSPCGYRVVFSCAIKNGMTRRYDSMIISCYVDGSDYTECNMRNHPPPFYYHWSPNSKYVAWLSNSNDGITLQVVDIEREPETSVPIEYGRPLFFSWCPDSTKLIANVSREKLVIHQPATVTFKSGQTGLVWLPNTTYTLSRDPEPGLILRPPVTLTLESGRFAAPMWHPQDVNCVFFVYNDQDMNILVSYNVKAAKIQRKLLQFPRFVKFEISPDGKRLAFWHGEDNPGPLYVCDLSDFEPSSDDITTTQSYEDNGPITISEGLESGIIGLIHENVFAFFWSPDSSSIAFLTSTGATIWLLFGLNYQWWRWDGENSSSFGQPFMTTRFFHQILTFFDQYYQSLRLWNSSSSAVICEHQREIRIIDVNGTTYSLGEGFWAIWAPR
eukprot:TRINITY_DN2024_c0_g1_i1.p1 TRINITY_DN2024_c0_g1~~TRINITY_DN2024_c0_g1_i1.p1  ORF type:complete len:626 (+),score=70.63 TRINITY_DN2024_c0_g1_i1:61-1878(+)